MKKPNRAQRNTSPTRILGQTRVDGCDEIKVVTVREGRVVSLHALRFDRPGVIVELWNKFLARSKHYQDDKEHVFSFLLDAKLRLKSFCLVSLGSLSESIMHPREVFRPAVVDCAHSIVVAHNHPSGDPTPSRADYYLTRTLYQAGELLQIPLVDHVIVAGRQYFSFREQGWPPRTPRFRMVGYGPPVKRRPKHKKKRKMR